MINLHFETEGKFCSQVSTAAADLDVLNLVAVMGHRVPVEAAVLVATAGVGGGSRVEEVVATEMFLSLGLTDVRLTEDNKPGERSDPAPAPYSQCVGELDTGAATRPGGGAGVESVTLVQHVEDCTLVAAQPGSWEREREEPVNIRGESELSKYLMLPGAERQKRRNTQIMLWNSSIL